MGGANEKILETPAKHPARLGKGLTLRKIRIHENDGEVHFHDDEAKLKVAVPVAKFWAAWSTNIELKDLMFHDTQRGTAALIRFSREPVEVNVQIHESKIGKSFKQLNDFAMGR
jgi:hypothetical protein